MIPEFKSICCDLTTYTDWAAVAVLREFWHKSYRPLVRDFERNASQASKPTVGRHWFSKVTQTEQRYSSVTVLFWDKRLTCR